MIRIKIAQNAGFCFGVKRAFALAVSAAEKFGKAYTLGRLVHNGDAIRLLEQKNVFVWDKRGIPADGASVIPSHGAAAKVTADIDATCPSVKKIHEIVSASEKPVIIAGDGTHPEIIGIVGHIRPGIPCYTVNSPNDLEELLINGKDICEKLPIMVAQTTFNRKKWRECKEIFKKYCTNGKFFDTICNATVNRQEEAERLSRECSPVIVIGSRESSNSVKLFEICSANRESVFFVENASGLKKILTPIRNALKNGGTVGIIAGASVPAEIIKEVHEIMNEEIRTAAAAGQTADEIDFMAEVDKTFQKIYTGKRVKAHIVAVNKTEAVADIGTKHSGYIPADEVGGVPVKPGDEVDCIVTSISDAEGIVYLSKKRVDSALGFERLTKAHGTEQMLEGVVTDVVNGGVIVNYEGTRVFVPASQSGVPKTGRLEELLKKNVKFKVIEINEHRSRVVGSIKAASRFENDAARVKFWEEISVGKHFTGEVKSIENYGVFVDLGGVDGMVHLTELTWKRVKHPKEVVSIGDVLNVTVKSYDPERKRVSLTAKDPGENPWTKFVNEYSVGDTVKATVVNITPFGAFAQIIPGIDGLVHISQISLGRVKNVSDELKIGDEVEARITEIDADKERVSISIKELLEEDRETADN